MSHLIGLGHRRIGLITNAPLSYMAAQDRLTGYRQALQEAELPLDDELVRYGEFPPESGRRAMESLLALPSPLSAVFGQRRGGPGGDGHCAGAGDAHPARRGPRRL